MKNGFKISCFILAALLLGACGEEEYVYPNLITEISCLKTDNQGYGCQIITDDGTTWHLRKENQLDSLASDSIYRVISRFAPLTTPDADKPEARAYSFAKVIASIPIPKDSLESIHTDPVNIQSIWRSGEYLNMILLIKVKDKKSKLAFVDNGISTNSDGSQTLTLTLFHNRNNDIEGFDQKYHLSVPLWNYKNILHKGDLIVFNLNTYKEGATSRTFTY